MAEIWDGFCDNPYWKNPNTLAEPYASLPCDVEPEKPEIDPNPNSVESKAEPPLVSPGVYATEVDTCTIVFRSPEYVWSCDCMNGAIHIKATKENVPNAFHRLMQRIILGYKWRKLKG